MQWMTGTATVRILAENAVEGAIILERRLIEALEDKHDDSEFVGVESVKEESDGTV